MRLNINGLTLYIRNENTCLLNTYLSIVFYTFALLKKEIYQLQSRFAVQLPKHVQRRTSLDGRFKCAMV